jgi:F-type H+-transporting ATPase subunit a
MASEKHEFDPFSHVVDSDHIELFDTAHVTIHLPSYYLPGVGPVGTKFLLMQLIAAGLMLWLFLWVAKRIATGQPPKGRLWNFLEWILLFVRDQVAKPALGEHDYKRFLPYLWTLFLFILFMNLLGMIPFMASATACLAVTAALALVSFVVIHYNGYVANHGFMGYMKTFVPHIDTNDPVMKYMGPPLMVGMFFLEVLGAFIRALVLAVRLFANMLAGHTVLFIILSFIAMIGLAAHDSPTANLLFWPITGVSILMNVALSMLELFVACLQAFVFTFLTAIFIGLAMHPQH